jgi:hypothetical protein
MSEKLYSATSIAAILGVSADDMNRLFAVIKKSWDAELKRVAGLENRYKGQPEDNPFSIKVSAFCGWAVGDGYQSKMLLDIVESFNVDDFREPPKHSPKMKFCAVIRNEDFSKFESLAYRGLQAKKKVSLL